MADNERGFDSELGPRIYRPEYPKNHLRQHNVFFPSSAAIDFVLAQLTKANALHRAAFVAAADAARGFFLDLMQVPEEIPVPRGSPWCAILNDDEPATGGARGPAFFHLPSLTTLVSSVRTVVVISVGVRAPIYAIACERTVTKGENTLLIETQRPFEREWMSFVGLHTINCRSTLVKESPSARDFLAPSLEKNRASYGRPN